MTDEATELDLPLESEIDSLKARAAQMGIKHHPAIGVDKLKEKIQESLDGVSAASDEKIAVSEPVTATATETSSQLKKRLIAEAHKLIRVNITCMNPNKKEWTTECFQAGNRVLGMKKVYVPYNVDTHVPQIILNMIQNRKCQIFSNKKVKGETISGGRLIPEYAVSILPPLTAQELKDLAQRQAMAAGTSEAAA
jgi:hypothetical protein